MNPTNRLLAAMGALILLVLAQGPAPAAQPVTRQQLSYDRGALATPAGVAHLHQRLLTAAREVCAGYAGSHPSDQRMYLACVEQTLRQSVTRVHSPALSAYHRPEPADAPLLGSVARH